MNWKTAVSTAPVALSLLACSPSGKKGELDATALGTPVVEVVGETNQSVVENIPPVINSVDYNSTLAVGDALSVYVNASDENNNTLNYQYNINGDSSVDQNTTFNGLPVGEHNLSVYVNDGQGGEVNATYPVTVNEKCQEGQVLNNNGRCEDDV